MEGNMGKIRVIVMKSSDNVCTVVESIEPGSVIAVPGKGEEISITVSEKIPFGHKFALRPIQPGDPIIKYGEVIGVATHEIAPGQHVHVHNLESRRGRGDK
jgi:altronate dehydratase small subunit